MDSGIDRLVCGREEDLVTFLYGELDELEAHSFRSHIKDCAPCSSEVSAFRDVRQSVIDWRNESLSPQSHVALGSYPPAQRRSAMAAVREFFDLSPVWMKATVGFASVLFCIFAVLAVSGLRKTSSPIVAARTEIKPSATEINAMVEQRVKEELNRLKAERELAAANTGQEITATATSHRKRVANPSRQDARRPLTRVEREQLAADLRLIPGTNGTNDIELELLDDVINQ